MQGFLGKTRSVSTFSWFSSTSIFPKISWLIHSAASKVETRMRKKSDKIPLRVSIRKTLTDFAENTTIHGIGYIFNTLLPFIERCLWTVAFGFFACLAIYLSAKAAVEWQSDPVITTVKSTGRNKLVFFIRLLKV